MAHKPVFTVAEEAPVYGDVHDIISDDDEPDDGKSEGQNVNEDAVDDDWL
jgi:hypothetical protein